MRSQYEKGAFDDQGLPGDSPLDGIVDATQTLQALADAIAVAGGPTYEFIDVLPEDELRVAFLVETSVTHTYTNPARVKLVSFESLTSNVSASAGVVPVRVILCWPYSVSGVNRSPQARECLPKYRHDQQTIRLQSYHLATERPRPMSDPKHIISDNSVRYSTMHRKRNKTMCVQR